MPLIPKDNPLRQSLRPLADVPLDPDFAERVRARALVAAIPASPPLPARRPFLSRIVRTAAPLLFALFVLGYFSWSVLFLIAPHL